MNANRINYLIKKKDLITLPTRLSVQMHGHTQTESEAMEKDIPCKYKPKESWGSDTQTKQT